MRERLAGGLAMNPADHPDQDGAFEGAPGPTEDDLKQISLIIAQTGLPLVAGFDEASLFHHLAASKTVHDAYQQFRQIKEVDPVAERLSDIATAAKTLRGKLMLAQREQMLAAVEQAFPKPVVRTLNPEYGGVLALQTTEVTTGIGPVVNEAEPSLQAVLNGLEMLTKLLTLVPSSTSSIPVPGDASFAASPQEALTVDILGEVYASHFGMKPARSKNADDEFDGPFIRFVRASCSYLGVPVPKPASISRHLTLSIKRRKSHAVPRALGLTPSIG
jgi:hypothetical protein